MLINSYANLYKKCIRNKLFFHYCPIKKSNSIFEIVAL